MTDAERKAAPLEDAPLEQAREDVSTCRLALGSAKRPKS